MNNASENLIIAALQMISDELDIAMWNKTQENYNSPFSNTGNNFKNDTFEVRAYYWGADEEEMKKPNFKYKNIEISWYKYLGRGMDIPDITYDELDIMLNDCLRSLNAL